MYQVHNINQIHQLFNKLFFLHIYEAGGRDENRSGRPSLRQVRPSHAFFLNREGLGFFRSLFSLKAKP